MTAEVFEQLDLSEVGIDLLNDSERLSEDHSLTHFFAEWAEDAFVEQPKGVNILVLPVTFGPESPFEKARIYLRRDYYEEIKNIPEERRKPPSLEVRVLLKEGERSATFTLNVHRGASNVHEGPEGLHITTSVRSGLVEDRLKQPAVQAALDQLYNLGNLRARWDLSDAEDLEHYGSPLHEQFHSRWEREGNVPVGRNFAQELAARRQYLTDWAVQALLNEFGGDEASRAAAQEEWDRLISAD